MRRFILDHWRGQFGMVAAFWGILVYPLILVIGTGHVLTVFNLIQDQVLSTRFWLAVAAFMIVIYLPWAFIGALRSILLHMTKLQATSGAIGLLVCWVIALGVTIHQVTYAVPAFRGMAAIAFHHESDDLTISQQGDRLVLSGELTYGSHRHVIRAMKEADNLTTIEMNLSAPHVYEARQVAKAILKHKLNTHVENECTGNCLIPFAAGYYRTAAADAHFAFYEYLNYANGYRTEWLIGREREKDRQYFERRGANLKYSFILFYRYTDNAPYEPTAADLLRGGLLADILSVSAS